MVDFKELMKFIVHTDNPIIFNTYQIHGKNLYLFDEEKGWRLDVTEEKIIDMLFDMVKNLNEQNKLLRNSLFEIHNTSLQPIILKKGD